jgi:ABC-2 type transport system permease protein
VLWWKAWRESRGRFLSAAIVLAAFCWSSVGSARLDFPPRFEPHLPYTTFIWRGIYNGPNVIVFVIVSIALGLGGVMRERAVGTAPFTLSLPVSRLALFGSRAGVGALQVVALAAIPALIVPWMSSRIGHPYPAIQAWLFAGLFAVVGLVWFAAGLLMSTLFTGEHTPTAAGLLLPFGHLALASMPGVRPIGSLNLFNVINGSGLAYLDAGTSLLVGPFPSAMLAVLLAAALSMAFAAGRLTIRLQV